MTEKSDKNRSRRIVLVVAVDLTDVTEHLLSNARLMLRSRDEAELHVVHVVSRESFVEKMMHPPDAVGASEKAGMTAAQWELKRLCSAMAEGSNVKVVTHTPVGDPNLEVIRVAREVDADMVLVETHHDNRLFHVSVATQIVHDAPCSVLTLRRRSGGASPEPVALPAT